MPASRSAAIRSRLDHPIIDGDGHVVELGPLLLDYVRQIGGNGILSRFRKATDINYWMQQPLEHRRQTWTQCLPWWGLPARDTLDRATVHLPRLLYERMDELGIDFAILYSTFALVASLPIFDEDEELRRVTMRAINTYLADQYLEYADRMTPAAVIPMVTPQEAIEELDYAVNGLGLKAIQIGGYAKRPVPKVHHRFPELTFAHLAYRLDSFGIDSDYDYDPFWAKCIELKVMPAAHSSGMHWGSRQSVSNYMYIHLGSFAAAGEAICRSLFMGGVTRRFPDLKVAFLEGGVGWACNLYSDIVGHWEKRNAEAIHHIDPANLDQALLMKLFAEYGDEKITAKLDQIKGFLGWAQSSPPNPDEWSLCEIEKAEDIRELFEPHFYFGCEADDPMTAVAFNTKLNPFGARLRAFFSSDIGHWDVPDAREVVEESYELVEKGLLTEDDFRDFTFTNPATFYAGMNPDFFKGTKCEAAVARLIGNGSTRRA
jgi:predicted TIM-barrel fold metal-dependent hydrolase